VPINGTGLKIRDYVKRLLDLKADQWLVDGPAVSRENGHLFSSRAVDDSMLEVLEDLFVTNHNFSPLRLSQVKTFVNLIKFLERFVGHRTLKRWK
jgi:hypothetical protein